MLHGWIIIDKPVGPGSTQVVSAVKRALREGGYPKVKVGHGGTLDPLASGVLPIALGEATKLGGRMLDADKGYDFTIAFGAQTDTLDRRGRWSRPPRPPDARRGRAVLPRFTGPIEQVPPVYSALKVDGHRAYDLARAGEEVAMETRAVTIHRASRLASPRERVRRDGERPTADAGFDEITLSARVSKGTYIRSLARDIARALGTVGHVTMLRRTRPGRSRSIRRFRWTNWPNWPCAPA